MSPCIGSDGWVNRIKTYHFLCEMPSLTCQRWAHTILIAPFGLGSIFCLFVWLWLVRLFTISCMERSINCTTCAQLAFDHKFSVCMSISLSCVRCNFRIFRQILLGWKLIFWQIALCARDILHRKWIKAEINCSVASQTKNIWLISWLTPEHLASYLCASVSIHPGVLHKQHQKISQQT